MPLDVESTDVIVVGAGPIGLELAVALKRAGIDYRQYDARQIGHTVSWYAPQTRFFSSNERIAIAGVPLETPDQSKATREQYLAYLRSVATQFGLAVRTFEPVTAIEGDAGGFVVRSRPAAGERTCRARRVVLCTGGTDHPRRLGIEGEDLPHVSHYFGDPHDHFGRSVLVIGGKNSAAEAALRCHRAGARVTLSYRGDRLPEQSIKYWILPELRGLIDTGAITAILRSVPTRITPSLVRLEVDGRAREVAADVVLALIGYEQDKRLLRAAGVELVDAEERPRFDPRTMMTNVPGLYVAGTAIGGTQRRFSVFIENCHVHVERIVASLTGAAAPGDPAPHPRPET